MDDATDPEAAIELLQQLGLKAYEAKSFVALSRRQSGNQHSNPKQYRAVPIDDLPHL